MARNRIIYNVEGVFVAPYSGEQNPCSYYYLSGYEILKKLEKIQSFQYSINQPRIDLAGFASKKKIYSSTLNSPEVNINFSYISDGVTNENRLNFNVGNFKSSQQEAMFSGICANSSILDQKDFYVIVNNNDTDLSSNYTFTDLCVNPLNLSDVIDPNSNNFSILEFKNCYINNYSFTANINSPPIVTQSYTCDNINYYLSGSGIKVSILDLKSGYNNILSEEIVIPKFLEYNQTGISGQDVLNPRDANITFFNSVSTGVLFYTDTIQNIDYSITFNRNTMRSLNYVFPLGRNIIFPIEGRLNIELLNNQRFSGSFFDTLDQNIDYNILINFNPTCSPGIYPTKLLISGCKFNDINYNSTIGTNNTANLSFSFDLDPDFATRGLFVSGNVLYGYGSGLSDATSFGSVSGLLATESSTEYELSWFDSYILNY